MPDNASTSSSKKGGAPETPRPRTVQGIQLLPLLIRYFKLIAALLGVWLCGYFGFSTAWIMIGLFAYMSNEEYKKVKESKKGFSKQAALDEKSAILARVEELPAWVYFPDIEKAEWLNKIIKQMWPYVGNYTKELLKTSIEPTIQNSLPKSLTPFKFETIDLGDIPPRIGGVKVYIDRVKRDEIIMDLELIYCSDSDIVVAVRGISAGIKDLQIHGTVRVQMKPLINVIPIIGGLNVFFLNTPKVDFDLTNTANILDVPVLSNTLRSVVEDQIAYYMVLPNKIPIKLADDVHLAALKYPMPQGVLRLNMVAGRELKAADIGFLGKGKSDPYCKIYVGAQTFKTKVVKETVTPVWNQYFEAVVDQKQGQVVDMEVFDQDPGEDDDLGCATLDINSVASQGSIDTWIPLEEVKSGMIHVRALWLHLSKDPDDLQKIQARNAESEPDPVSQSVGGSEDVVDDEATKENSALLSGAGGEEHLSTALLLVTLDSAKELPRSKKGMAEPSPFAKLKVGNVEKQGLALQNTTNPKWESNFEFLILDPNLQDLNIEVLDSKKKEKRLGSFTYALKNLLTCKDLTVNREFALEASNHTATVSMRLCLRILTSQMPEEWALDTGATEPTEEEELAGGDAKTDAAAKVPNGVPDSPQVPDSTTPDTTNVDSQVASETTVMSQSSSRQSSMIMDRSGEELRQRTGTMSSTSSDAPLGRIRITMRYSQQRQKLVVVIHNCVNLIACDEDKLADPYVRVYLLPERSSTHKRKTEVCKNNLNPIFDETVEWAMSLTEASSKTLELSVKNEVSYFSKNRQRMGVAFVDLSQFDLMKATTEWFDLTEVSDD